jgi:hypothetical protein
MRKMLILTAIAIVPAFGCCDGLETLRRVEVWKAQTFFTPAQPVVAAPAGCNPCGAPVATASACSCQNGAVVTGPTTVDTIPAVAVPATSAPATVSTGMTTGYPPEAAESNSTEELDGVLKQP